MLKCQNEQLPKQLMSWAKDEMKYQATSLSSRNNYEFPSEQDFKLLFQKPLDDVWKYILKHVKSVQTVKHVKGNIAVKCSLDAQKCLKSRPEKENEEESLKPKKSLSKDVKELTSCIIDISYLQKEMEQISKDVMETELSYQGISQHVRDLQRKESLLEVVCRASEVRINQYTNCAKQITEHIDQIKKTSDKSSDNFVMGGKSHKEGLLETKRDRDVRLACEHLSRFLRDFSSNKETLQKAESTIWKNVLNIAGLYSTQSVVTSLISHVENTTKSLREETAKFDLIKDAQELSFTFEEDQSLHDVSQPVPVEKTVKQLLEASNLRHVLRWSKEQEHKNDEWKLTTRLEDIKMEIHKHISRLLADHPRNIQLAKGYVDSLIQLAVEHAVLPCLREEVTRISEAIEIAKQEKQELHFKFEKIQDFKKIVGKKQAIISALAKQNSSAPERLSNKKSQVLSFVAAKSVEAQVSEMKLLTSGLRGNLSSEVDKFSSMVLPCLLVLSLDRLSQTRLCVLDLSIAPSMFYVLREKPWIHADVYAALCFPGFKSTDSLPLHVLDVYKSLQELFNLQQHKEMRIKSALRGSKTIDDISHFIELCNLMEQFDKSQCDKYIPKLNKGLESLTSSLKKIDTIKSLISVWWEQPAKYTTPWVIQEGKTLEQWMQKWRLMVTEIHKKMDDRNVKAQR
ncbi:HAUS augmin-like complex subunit 5 isoform X2 [Biomphalaria pfeifferi]|uniref:HAUS augmin-like complex subunit 5 isoform X2 n=1 Tax=Biomphalaria pfeifferi TaxID=112525 RepID=A0AAD8BD68_BIOPF|nr:HAUS augmin-like complex subunit 5 isoform X2 [Biomphalaria pfeifferi]